MSTQSNQKTIEKLLKNLLELNSMIYIGLGVLEQSVRAVMPQVFEANLGPGWLLNNLTDPGVPLFKEEANLITRRKSSRFVLDERKFLQECSMGFWVELFNPKTYKLLKGIPIQAFAYRPPGLKRNEIYRRFKALKDLRNDLVHNRLPLNTNKENILSLVDKLQTADTETREFLSYIDPKSLRLLPTTIDKKLLTIHKMTAAF